MLTAENIGKYSKDEKGQTRRVIPGIININPDEWELPNFHFWQFPRKGKAIFYGLYLGIVEFRYFPKKSEVK